MSDALERLKNRSRPTVPNRDASLTHSFIASESQDISISSNQDSQVSEAPESQKSAIQPVVQPLETKQTTLRLEQGMSDRLQSFCRENDICREVLVEAMFEYCEVNSEALQAVLSEAKGKNDHRQQIANQKRAKSMMQRFGQGES
jgi:hypothetical protein